MKILFKQDTSEPSSAFLKLSIENLYFKEISYTLENFHSYKKPHHHTCYEIHLLINGFQNYSFGDKNYALNNGMFLLVPPHTKHLLVDTSKTADKFSITFTTENLTLRNKLNSVVVGKIPNRILQNYEFIKTESRGKLKFKNLLLENAIFETLLLLFRASGYTPEADLQEKYDENMSLSLAKKYIKDNLEFSPSVSDVSKYCNLSPKHLTRLFVSSEEVTPLAYIQKLKIQKIQKLLLENKYSLKEISEIMNFNNEYYFNTFFKKYAGMPPGEYRSMHKTL